MTTVGRIIDYLVPLTTPGSRRRMKPWDECRTLEKAQRVGLLIVVYTLSAVFMAALVGLPGYGLYRLFSLASPTAGTVALSIYGGCVGMLILFGIFGPKPNNRQRS